MLRVLHDFTGPVERDLLVRSAGALRSSVGCVSAEAYASVTGDEHVALTALFESEQDYWTVWDAAAKVDDLRAVLDDPQRCVTEFYQRTDFAVADGIWAPVAADRAARRIFWPANGQVRIIIEYAVQPNDRMRALAVREIADTRHEPGCLQYDWLESLEVPEQLLLLEVWSDQVIYDRHSQKRVDTAAYRGDSLRKVAEPKRGVASREFYRRQCFSPQYDRWLPADVAGYSASVHWPAT